MARPSNPHPTDGELEILRVLWSAGPSSLSTICESLRTEREVATTTVATMLKVMLDKELVKRERRGSGSHVVGGGHAESRRRGGWFANLWRACLRVPPTDLATHLVEGGQLTGKQLAELRKLIDQQSK